MTQEGRDIARAFREGRRLRRHRTRCTGEIVDLHGSRIAWRDELGGIYLTLAGWGTVTTRDRLNAICAAFDVTERFSQCKFQQYFGDRPIDIYEAIPLLGPLGALVFAAERELMREAA